MLYYLSRQINHLDFASSVGEAKLLVATYRFLGKFLEPKVCGALSATLPNSSGKKRRCLSTNACTTSQYIQLVSNNCLKIMACFNNQNIRKSLSIIHIECI